ncbi:hypothetical protein IKF03_01865 [Candidatus Saccharibacteria bacterium]|nr:hypothetical protein [Candidatus Saccharibacteria bacterium]
MGNWVIIATLISTTVVVAISCFCFFKKITKSRRKYKSRRIHRPRDIFDDMLDLEFCPGMTWLFEVLNSQRRQFMRTCSRYGAVRHRIDDWRAKILVQAIERTDQTLEYNIGQILNLIVMAGYNPKWGFYQPEFRKANINRQALRSFLGENADVIENLDQLITTAVEDSWLRAEFTAKELDAWISSFKHRRDFRQDFKEEVA